MADAGYIAPEDVRYHKRRNVLTNFLGGHSGKVKGDIRWLRLADADRLLLCTDGLTEMVEDDPSPRSSAGITSLPTRPRRCSTSHCGRGAKITSRS